MLPRMLHGNAKITQKLHEEIVILVRAGQWFGDACEYNYVSRRTGHRWIERGQRELTRLQENPEAELNVDEKPYVEFCHAIQHARAYANIYDENVIAIAAKDDPTWAEKRLRRRNPERFREEVEVKHSGGMEVKHGLTDELPRDGEVREAIKLVRRRLMAGEDEPSIPSAPSE